MSGTVNAVGGDPAADLERRLRAVEPAVRLVRERHLRAILHRLADDGEPIPINPDLPLWVSADRLREYEILPADRTDGPADAFLLLTEPADRLPGTTPAAAVRLHYFKLLIQGLIHRELSRSIRDGRLTGDAIESRLDRLGATAVRELRYVLESDHVVVRGVSSAVLYPAFAALYLVQAYFDPQRSPWFFPSLPPPEDVVALLTGDVDFELIRTATRSREAQSGPPEPDRSSDVPEGNPSGSETARLSANAARAAHRGNQVRAALFLERAARFGEGAEKDRLRAVARASLRQGLVERLSPILGWDGETRARWAHALEPLLEPASRGAWPRAARSLYDLQKIAIDLGGELFAVNPIDWARSLGRRPLRRPLTRARPVVRLGHLRSARRNLARARLAPNDRDRLEALLLHEIHRAEETIRSDFGPVIRRALDEVGLRPASVPEAIARDKLVEELVDRVCERGFLRFADLRDAVARNQFKLPDLAGPVELLRGDALLQVDARLGEELDGIYRRGEFYLRWLQRGTATAFGTPAGRWLSQYVLLPFAGAFMIVEFARYLAHEAARAAVFVRRLVPADPNDPALVADPVGGAGPDPDVASASHAITVTPESVAAIIQLGVLILLLLHSPRFRALVVCGLARVWRGLVFLFADLPRAIWQWPPLRALRRSRVARWLARHAGPAVTIGAAVAWVLVVFGFGVRRVAVGAGSAFAVALAVGHTPIGRRMWDEADEALSDTWREVRVNLIPGLVSWVVWAFQAVVAAVERSLYAIDEWFRFREGQSGGSLGLKAALAVVWFPVEYLFRFAFYLLLEPQVNPIKHFPVVTVSHKLLFPLIGVVAEATGLSVGIVTLLIWCLPGIFGFIAWELKENWRLYAANRPAGLSRVVIGHHGETMRGLLRPGFHSGTVPGLFRKLRSALNHSERTGQPARTDRYRHGLAEVRHAVERFVERDLVALLAASEAWSTLSPRCGPVRLGVQSIDVGIAVAEADDDPLGIHFEHIDGDIVSRVSRPGWLARLTDGQRAELETAIAGFCELGAARLADRPSLSWDGWVAFWDSARLGKKP
jgi:hypothetical protein